MAKKHEYVMRQIEEGKYEVCKFDPDTIADGGQPLAVYTVLYNPPRQMGKCDCQAAAYRGTGPTDKHVGFVVQWITDGRRTTIVA